MIGVHDFSSVSDAVQFDDTLTIHRDSTYRKQDGMISAAELDGPHAQGLASPGGRLGRALLRRSHAAGELCSASRHSSRSARCSPAVEKLYRDRDLAPAFQLSPATRPVDLDEILEALRPLLAYLALIALRALNPATLIYFAALVLGGQTANSGSTLMAAAVFAVGAFLASASWQLFLAGSGAALGRLITGVRGQLAVAVISGAIMIALAGNLLVS